MTRRNVIKIIVYFLSFVFLPVISWFFVAGYEYARYRMKHSREVLEEVR